MAGERLAKGIIEVDVNDRNVTEKMHRVSATFDREMQKMGRQRAVAHIDANIRELSAKTKEAEAQVKRLKGLEATIQIKGNTKDLVRARQEARAEIRKIKGLSATARIKGDSAPLTEEIKKAELQVDRLKGKEAVIRIRAEGGKRAIADIAATAAFNEKMTKLREKENDRINTGLSKGPMLLEQQRLKVVNLQKEYVRLTDEAERAGKASKKGAFTQEGRVRLQLDERGIRTKLELVKEQLKILGSHPPVGVKIDIDADAGFLRRRMFGVQRMLGKFADKFSGIGQTKVNIGPLSISLRVLGVLLAVLGPVVTSLIGSLTALVGVLGTGLAGALAVSGGLMAGFAMNMGGLLLSVRPAIKDYHQIKLATDAYNKALLRNGKGSKEATDAHKQMMQSLKGADPLARAAATGMSKFQAAWEKATAPTRRSLAGGLKDAFGGLNKMIPTLSKNTNEFAKTISTSMSSMFAKLSSPGGLKVLGSIGHSFNQFLGPALSGIEHLGAAFGHIAEAAGRIFAGKAGEGFNKWAANIDKATQPGAKLDSIVTRIGTHAADLLHFFAALGRLMVTVFNGGATSGDRMVNSMTKAMNRWNEQLKKPEGQRSMERFFNRTEEGTRALFSALAPIVKAFVEMSQVLAPISAFFLKGVAAVAGFAAGIVHLIAQTGPVKAFAASLGAIWAVSKIGGFISMLARAVALVKELGAIGTLKALGTGSFFGQLKTGPAAGITQASEVGAAAYREAILEGSTQGAALMRAAEAEGGALAAAEIGAAEKVGAASVAGASAGGVLLPAGAARNAELAGSSAAAATTKFGRLRSGIAGAAGSLIGPVGLVAAAGIGIAALANLGTSVDEDRQKIYKYVGAAKDMHKNIVNAFSAARPAAESLAQSQSDLRDANKGAADAQARWNKLSREGKLNTDAGRQATRDLNAALLQQQQVLDQVGAASRQMHAAMRAIPGAEKETAKASHGLRQAMRVLKDELGVTGADALKSKLGFDPLKASAPELLKNKDKIIKGLKDLEDQGIATGVDLGRLKKDFNALSSAEKALATAHGDLATKQAKVAILQTNFNRAMKGMVPLANSAGTVISELNSKIGKFATQKIALKFPDPRQAQSALSGVNRALNAGVSSKKAINVVANSATAEEALRRLNRLTLRQKVLNLRVDGMPRVNAAVNRLLGLKLPDKTMRMIGNVADAVRKHGLVKSLPDIKKLLSVLGKNQDARNAFAQVLGFPNIRRLLTVLGRDQATSVYHSILSAIPSSITRVINVITKHLGHATGGIEDQATKRAMQAANRKTPREARSGRYDRPTYVVGEEDRTEYIIATNPAHRKMNQFYLASAARDLGYGLVELPTRFAGGGLSAAGHKAKKHKKHQVTGGARAGGGLDYDRTSGAVFAGLDMPLSAPAPYIHKKKKLHSHSLLKGRTPASDYVKRLLSRQSDLEREVSIRESQVKEPESFLKESPPGSGKFVRDESAIGDYRRELESVDKVYAVLLAVIKDLTNSVPAARREVGSAIAARHHNITLLKRRISRDNTHLKSHNKGTRQNAARDKSRAEKALSSEQSKLAGLEDEYKNLPDERKEAGFDYRETAIAKGDIDTDLGAIEGKVTKEQKEGGPGGGGGAATPEVYGPMVLDTERGALFRDFGSNFQPIASVGQQIGTHAAESMAAALAPAGGGGTSGLFTAAVGGGGAGMSISDPASAAGGMSGAHAIALTSPSGPTATLSGAAGTSGAAGAGGTGVDQSVTKNVTQHITITKPPPDPLTWSHGVKFNLEAAL
jgi:hypothetical protein